MKKYPKIRRLGHRSNDGLLESDHITVQEKLDGANFRFTLQRNIDEEYHDEDRDLVFGSRNVVYKNEKDSDKNFNHAIEHVRNNVNLSRLKELDEKHGPLTFYGEAMHPHTLDYEWDDVPSFLGFDVWTTNENYGPGVSNHDSEWFRSGDMRWTFKDIGLESAPLLHCGVPSEFDPEGIPESEYRDGKAEGYVIKAGTSEYRQVAKVRSKEFKEMHATQSPDKDDTEYMSEDAVVLAQQFTTEARIIKTIHKMENEGYNVEMGMMEDLWERVFNDIIEEEHDTIFLGNHTIDTKQFRSEVASRCAKILDTYLSRPDDSALNEANT